jgi:molecular chaperone HtpG
MGRINVTAENIFPIIKKFLYSDHEIFLRELVSNAVDATLKLKTLSRLGEIKGELGELAIEVKIDKEAGTLTISDRGIGMTEEEVNKYINEVAFSGAEEFLQQYKDKASDTGIIGHFGLGFYSAFMVADKVEIRSKSARLETTDASGSIHWECKGDPEFEFSEGSKTERGTDIILHINADNQEFLEDYRLTELLKKYCRFLPIPIQFGTKEEKRKQGEGEGAVEETIVLPNYVNNPIPAWTKSPSELKDEDYQAFYSELYPMSFEKPLFHIHLNVDYPFNLNGILYFPRIKPNMDLNRNKIQLYQNQVFVTDSVEGIVPDFLTLLHGVIDSKDIPLNVSRSYLQADGNVKKISGHITKKVADKLEEMFKNDRASFEKNWDDTKMIVEYGMLSEEKFYDRAKKFFLLKDTEGVYHTIEEFKEKVDNIQKNKEGNTIWLYASDLMAQHNGIEEAKTRGYQVLLLNSPLNAHLTDRLERDLEKVQFARVDSDSIDRIISKEDDIPSKLTEDQEKQLKELIESAMDKDKFKVEVAKLNSDAAPIQIHVPEFMRRMKEMSSTGGGGFMGMTDFPETYQVVVNANHPMSEALLSSSEAEREESLNEAIDLALLGQNLLHGAALSKFIKRTQKQLEIKLGV